MWIVRIALNRPYTFVVLAILILFVGPLAISRTPTDIFPNINIPVVTVVWSYGGMSAEEMAQRIVTQLRARPDDDGQRHRAHRVADAARHVDRQGLLPARREDRSGGRADHVDLAVGAAQRCRRARPAVHHHVQRLDRSDPAARAVGQRPLRAAALRPRRQLPARPAGHGPGRLDSVALRRQAGADPGGPRSAGAPGQGAVADRRRQRDRRAEPDPARRHVEDRRLRIRRAAERQPRHASRS